jgi:hypothetical protein
MKVVMREDEHESRYAIDLIDCRKLDNLIVELIVCANSRKQIFVFCDKSQYVCNRSRRSVGY